MKIYVNDFYEIVGLDNHPVNFKEVFEVTNTREEMFGNLCDACILGYKYSPVYEMMFNTDGTNQRDDKGDIIFRKNDKGEKNLQGYSYFPFVDFKTLLLIQKHYEDSQKQTQALNARIEYLSMMSGIETEVGHE
jgi:hypothetical protein